MSRPKIMRYVDEMPIVERFGPLNHKHGTEVIIMSIVEYETIRLIDQLNLTQAECGEKMRIGRTTAQRIYNNARKKLAECIISGKILQIEGGNYSFRGQGQRRRHGRGQNRFFE